MLDIWLCSLCINQLTEKSRLIWLIAHMDFNGIVFGYSVIHLTEWSPGAFIFYHTGDWMQQSSGFTSFCHQKRKKEEKRKKNMNGTPPRF